MKTTLLLFAAVAASAFAQARIDIALPERTRLLEDQRIDIVVEARNIAAGVLTVKANGADLSARFAGPTPANLDCDATPDASWRADMVSFQTTGWVRLEATLATSQGVLRTAKDILVQPFPRP